MDICGNMQDTVQLKQYPMIITCREEGGGRREEGGGRREEEGGRREEGGGRREERGGRREEGGGRREEGGGKREEGDSGKGGREKEEGSAVSHIKRTCAVLSLRYSYMLKLDIQHKTA